MKSLAELIAELQKIPNPEKIGVALLSENFYIPLSKSYDASQTSDFVVLFDSDAAKARAQGFEALVTF
jgi:hypothetical protein